jgi:hypothetical protein
MMTDVNTDLDLNALHDAIVADVRAKFPDIPTVEFYRTEERRSVPCPAILLDLCEMEPEPEYDVGTGQLAVTARFEAQIIIGFKTPDVKRAIRTLAGSFAAWLRLRRWSGIVGQDAAQVVSCRPDEFDPRLDEYEVWCVEWTQVLYLGENAWADTSAPLTLDDHVMIGYAPNVGPPNVDKYTKIEINPAIIKPVVPGDITP